MQFGIFSVGDITTNPVTGKTVNEYERQKNIIEIGKKAEEIGLDVFAVGQHHNPPFIASSPTTTLAYLAAQTKNIILSTSTTLITTTDPVRIAEDYGTLQHLADGRTDLMLGRGNTGPVYPWFGKDIREGVSEPGDRELRPAAQALARRACELVGALPHAAQRIYLNPAPAQRCCPVRMARQHPYSQNCGAGGILRRRLLPQQHLLA